MRAEQKHTGGGAVAADQAPGSHLALRGSPSSTRGTGSRPREESTPPTKPSIAPPSQPTIEEAPPIVRAESPLSPFHSPAPTLTYGMVVVLAAAALGFGALLVAATARENWVSGLPWVLAAVTLVFSLSMAVVLTLSFARRLNALARAAHRLAFGGALAPREATRNDAVTSLARCLTKMSERIQELAVDLDRASDQEQGRLDALVRERTRDISEENEDLRRVLGDSKGVLGVDRTGKLLGQASTVISKWLGTVPAATHFWQYFEQAAPGAGERFESAWAELLQQVPAQIDFRCMPRTLAVGERYLALEYRAVCSASSELSRVLLVLTDITIPEPDPATPV